MNASFTSTLMGDAGVTVNAEKEGVNDLDHRIRPPYHQLTVMQRKYMSAYSGVISIRGLACWAGYDI
jgi:hypothetical protein